MDVLGLIFSDIQNKESFEVTTDRTIASVPVGGRYRLIDFVLSHLSNAGVKNVGIITKNNYQSLMGHVGAGKEWDLARKNGGLVLLPPYSVNTDSYTSKLSAIKGVMPYLDHSHDEYVIMTDCYHICNVDYTDLLEKHIQSGADITGVYSKTSTNDDTYFPIKKVDLDKNGRFVKLDILDEYQGEYNASLGIWVMKLDFLRQIVRESVQTNYQTFSRDVIKNNVNNYKIRGYEYTGYFGNIYDLDSYYKVNKDLLKDEVRQELFYSPGRPIYTKVRDSAPTKYGKNAKVENSLIADGCVIEGEVYNSVLFRGTKVAAGCVVKDSILFQDTTIGGNVKVEYVITDKKVSITNKKELIGSEDNLIYVKKGGVL